MKLLGKTTDYDKIVSFMKDEIAETELSEHQQSLVKRWLAAWTHLQKFMTTSDAVAILLKTNPQLSRASAYRDCANALSLFGDIGKAKKEGIRHLTTEMLKDSYALAVKLSDPDAMIKAARAIAYVNGVNNIDPEAIDWEKLEPHTYEIGIDPIMIAALQSLIKGGKIDLRMLTEAMNSQATDAVIVSETTSNE